MKVTSIPQQPKIYHIVHVDCLLSIVKTGALLSDAHMQNNPLQGTTIGISEIKQRRLQQPLRSYPDLCVGHCVPFYFCPRSVMLYLIYKGNHPDLSYRGGQEEIVHLQADLYGVVQWANQNGCRWAFTSSNAGSAYFEDYSDLTKLDQINWAAVQALSWSEQKEGKQAEFLLEDHFPWHLVEHIGVYSNAVSQQVRTILSAHKHRPPVEVCRPWYY